MPVSTPKPLHSPEALRTPLSGAVECPDRRCRVCGHLLTGRQQATCSPRCRVAWHRRRRAEARAERDAEIRHHAEAIVRLLDGRGTRWRS
jgi:hypothetical protein